MADTYTLLEKITVGAAGASSVTFTSIPQTYTDLQILVSARSTRTSDFRDELFIRFNSDSGNNYSVRDLNGSGSTAGTSSSLTTNYLKRGTTPTDNATASTFSNNTIYIPNYTGSNQKSVSTEEVTENNSSTNNYLDLRAGLWTGTSAITSISLTPEVGPNFAQYSTFYLYGIAKDGVTPAPSSAPYATGGDSILFDGTYWIHTFTSSGTFTPKKGLTCDYLVVAGGGGGASRWGGGGGAGGLKTSTGFSVTNGTNYTVTVGAGGAGGSGAAYNRGSTGSNSVFSTITSTGGGGGGTNGLTPTTGGSGGGGGFFNQSGAAGTSGEGNAGGNAWTTTAYAGGGGGGSSAVGANAPSAGDGGNGGAGTSSSYSGSTVTYAGGGGGGCETGTPGTGGSGGGGAGAKSAGTGTAGTTNLGGGGGGGGNDTGTGGAGGSGIVIVRYAA